MMYQIIVMLLGFVSLSNVTEIHQFNKAKGLSFIGLEMSQQGFCYFNGLIPNAGCFWIRTIGFDNSWCPLVILPTTDTFCHNFIY